MNAAPPEGRSRWRRVSTRKIVLVVVLLVLGLVVSWGASRTVTEQAPEQSADGWRLVWSDDFDGDELDPTKWNAENLSTYGDGANGLACLMDRRQNLDVNGGQLHLIARREQRAVQCGEDDDRFPEGREYTSAHLNTIGKAEFGYGRFEVRARLPTQAGTSQGMWPAFWMRPSGGGIGELDVLEALGSGPQGDEWNRIHHAIHYDYVGTHPVQNETVVMATGVPSDGMHTYVAEWEPGRITWFVDDVQTWTRDRTTTPWLDEAFEGRFVLRLNLAVGGNWPGSPTASTHFPASMDVDYVRVYERD